MDVPFSNYLNRMSIDGTFDDEITLIDAAELFNINLLLFLLSAEQLKQL